MTQTELNKLTSEQKRIQIAEACGHKLVNEDENGDKDWYTVHRSPSGQMLSMRRGEDLGWSSLETCSLPDYLNSLDAMHGVEETIHPASLEDYVSALGPIVREYWSAQGKRVEEFSYRDIIYAHMHATATQRADAFLLAVG